MKITRSRLTEIVAEEVTRALREAVVGATIAEDEEEGGGERKKSKKPGTASADDNPTKPQDVPAGPQVKPADAAPGDPPPEDGGKSAAAPDGGEDADGPDPEAVDQDGDAGEEPSGAVNDEVSGKTVQAVTIEPKSKVLPGAKEIVLAFNESTDALRILVTPTGQVKFFWRGQLHDLP